MDFNFLKSYSQEMQTKRGGGSVCHFSQDISNSYRALISDFEPCRADADNNL